MTLPVAALREAGFGPGTRLEVSVNDWGEIVPRDTAETAHERLMKVVGSLTGMYPPGYLEEPRKEWPE